MLKSTFLLFLSLFIFLPLQALDIRLEVRSAIDEAADNSNWQPDAPYLKRVHEQVITYMQESLKLRPPSPMRKILSNPGFVEAQTGHSLIILATFVAFELSHEHAQTTSAHAIQNAHGMIIQAIEESSVSSVFGDLLNQRKLSLKPLILLENKGFLLDEFFYALSKGVLLYTLPNQKLENIHEGLFASPLEVFLHDNAHYHDIFGLSGEPLLAPMQNLAAKFLNWKVNNTDNFDKSELVNFSRLMFVLMHEPAIIVKLSEQDCQDSFVFFNFLQRNLMQYFAESLLYLSDKETYHRIVCPNADMDKIDNFYRYEQVKTAHSDYPLFLEQLTKGAYQRESLLGWDPKVVVAKYKECFEKFTLKDLSH